MQKLSHKHFTSIVELVQEVLKNKTSLHKFDLVYIQKALDNFIANKNVSQLYTALMEQDRIIREYCSAVLRYIKNNELM